MKGKSNQSEVVDIYAFLEMPVSRSPRSFGNQAPVQALPGMVQDAGNFANAPEIGTITHDESALYGQQAAAVNIPPMLQPQAGQPEFFLNNFAKAQLAQSGISKLSFEHFKLRTGLDYNQLAWLLSVARNTLINKKGEDVFDVTISEKLIALAEVYTHGFDVFGSEDVFIQWLNHPNRALGMVTPFSLLQTQYGRQEVQDILGRIEWGVYS
jgi:putative toxin-antitoxin system antitoxin component (TIGR02293 family)